MNRSSERQGSGTENKEKTYVPRYAPTALYRRVQATLERGWAGRREVAISAKLTQERPKDVDFDFIDGIVRLGYVDGLIVLFDAAEYMEFIPKITRLFGYTKNLRVLRLFSDTMLPKPALPFYSRPNVLDSLPPRMDTLTTFHIATYFNHLQYDIIARVLIRARNLQALKIEGPRLLYQEPKARKDRWQTYISCQLKHFVVMNTTIRIHTLMDMLSKSGDSLETLHIEQLELVNSIELVPVVMSFVKLQRMTIITPPSSAVGLTENRLQSVVDMICIDPALTIRYLFLEGLCVSHEAFLLPYNNRSIIQSQWPSLMNLVLHDCEHLSAEDVAQAMTEGRLPNLSILEAMWPRAKKNVKARNAEIRSIAILLNACKPEHKKGVKKRRQIVKPVRSMGMYYYDIFKLLEAAQHSQQQKKMREQVEAAQVQVAGDLQDVHNTVHGQQGPGR